MATESFAQRLKRLREEAGLTQQRLAELAGINTSTIGKIETGERAQPLAYTVRGLARALGISMDDLVGDACLGGPYPDD